MRLQPLRREAITDPRSRLILGITTGLMAVAGDTFVSGFGLVRSSFTLSLILFGYWLLTPIAVLSLRAPLQAGLIAATFGVGGGAIWWALASPRYSLWLMLAMGACIALYSLAPVEVRRAHRPPPRRPSLIARLRALVRRTTVIDARAQNERKSTDDKKEIALSV